ncbi:hypothetical protein LCGC14_0928210 [marine sediment metagenome]|uniref:Uncharacterized protein n=1 Tax=marine sediment metagenome TaxID=412755 RepID=A0A0F9NNW7_9ZZZZ
MRRLAMGIVLVLVLATSLFATQFKTATIVVPTVSQTATQVTTSVNTLAQSVIFQPYMAHANVVMWIGDSNVAVANGIRLTHGQTLSMDAPALSNWGGDMFDLSNVWAVCDSVEGASYASLGTDCSLIVTYSKQE